jgi:hypothetical protein
LSLTKRERRATGRDHVNHMRYDQRRCDGHKYINAEEEPGRTHENLFNI